MESVEEGRSEEGQRNRKRLRTPERKSSSMTRITSNRFSLPLVAVSRVVLSFKPTSRGARVNMRYWAIASLQSFPA